MSISIGKHLLGGVVALLFGAVTAFTAEQEVYSLYEGVPEYWSSAILRQDAESTKSEAIASDSDGITPVQMLAPQARTAQRSSAGASRSAVARRNPNLASVPFMIGDTGAGSCVSFGNLLDVTIGHPTLGCSRLNISEGNTPLPIDRVYFSYRHFHNSTPVNVFQFAEDFNIDRYTFGGERTFFQGMMSAELRLPIEMRLGSDIRTSIVDPPPVVPGAVVGTDIIVDGKQAELANISMVFKALMIERSNFAATAGLGVTLPSAQDVTYNALLDAIFTNTFPDGTEIESWDRVIFDAVIANETVYLSPFLAWLWQPEQNRRFFHQGFMQVEVAANPSRVDAIGVGSNIFDTSGDGVATPGDPLDTELAFFTPSNPLGPVGSPGLGRTELQPQTLLRLNLGVGYVLAENRHADFIQKLTSLFELHYTTTLGEANINSIPIDLTINGAGISSFQSIDVGNADNRVDILNAVAGLSANVNNYVITNGFTAPIRTGSDRGFDFEYNLQVQRPF